MVEGDLDKVQDTGGSGKLLLESLVDSLLVVLYFLTIMPNLVCPSVINEHQDNDDPVDRHWRIPPVLPRDIRVVLGVKANDSDPQLVLLVGQQRVDVFDNDENFSINQDKNGVLLELLRVKGRPDKNDQQGRVVEVQFRNTGDKEKH